jgi:hypothetical protein
LSVFGKLILVLAAGVTLAGCGAQLRNAVVSPERPGTTIRYKNPNSEKWTSVTQPRQTPGVSIYICKPLACAGNAAVSIRTLRSPTRHPDHEALEKAAKLLLTQAKAQDLLADAASDGDERIAPVSSKVTEIRGYPAILAETKRTSRGKARYFLNGHLFIGLQLVQLTSVAQTSTEAKRNFDQFTASLDILDFEASSAQPSETSDLGENAAPEPAMQGKPAQ